MDIIWNFFCFRIFIEIFIHIYTFSLIYFFIFNYKKYKKSLGKYFISILISLSLLTPHFFWLFENNFITIFYGLDRSGVSEFNYIDHFTNPIIFLIKQFIILIPFFLMLYIVIKKFKFSINKKNKETIFLLSINLIPISLILVTSVLTGAEIRTMWMTPFYLFLGTLFIFILKNSIDLKKLKNFIILFVFLYFFSICLSDNFLSR